MGGPTQKVETNATSTAVREEPGVEVEIVEE